MKPCLPENDQMPNLPNEPTIDISETCYPTSKPIFVQNESTNPHHLNRRDKHSGVNAAVTFDSRDAVAEAIGTYLRRVIEVFALKPAASNKYQ